MKKYIWIKCKKCGKEWNDLMSSGVCWDCHFAEKMQELLTKSVEELEGKYRNVTTKEIYE